MNRDNSWHNIVIVILLLAIFAIWLHIYDQETQCTNKGGKNLRSLFSTYMCYDKASLKEMK